MIYLAAADYFRESLGFDNITEVTRILDIAMNPNSLYGVKNGRRKVNPHARKLSVDDDIKPVIEWLMNLGMDKQAVVRVLVEHPTVLCYSIRDRLQPFIDLLQSEEVGLSQAESITLLQKRASILGMDPQNLYRIVKFLVDQEGVPRQDILKLLETSL